MQPKILIVDDEPDVCKDISRFLSATGYCAVIAADGEEALSMLSQENPDLVLLDIRMPGMDGTECLREIKKLDKDIIVIMVTCVTDIDIAKKALELGAIDYITKPFSLDVLEAAISTYLFLKSAR